MRTSNPVLSDNLFGRRVGAGEGTMTMNGTVAKTSILAILLLISGSYTWNMLMNDAPGRAMGLAIGGALAGLVFVLIAVFQPKTAPFTAPLYAIAEGLALGAISAAYQVQYAGLPVQAAGLTVFTLIAMLIAYRTGLIKATPGLRRGIIAATGGICLFYLASIVASMFGVTLPLIHSSGPMGILFTLAVIVVAALSLVLDFDFIEQGSQNNLPEYMEWIGALGLIVTLAWLYLEILRLLGKMRK